MSQLDQLMSMPQWKCHEVVRAARIAEVITTTNTFELRLDEAHGGGVVTPRGEIFSRMIPGPGDYLVLYDDGYLSLSPRAAFEDGYALLKGES